MSHPAVELMRFYRSILRLYPPRYREVYTEEMLAVFQMQLDDWPDLNAWSVLAIIWGELHPLPGLLTSAYLRERKQIKMNNKINHWFRQPEGSPQEFWLMILPFIVIGLLPSAPIVILLGLFLVILGIIGLRTGLPRWSLVYFGVFLTVIIFVGMDIGAQISDNYDLFHFPPAWSPIQASVLVMGVFLIGLLILTSGVIWLSGKIKLTTEFHQRVKTDPGMVSLMLYGSALVVVVTNFENISGLNFYPILASLAMAVGAWGFLRTHKPASRLGALLGGATVAIVPALIFNFTEIEYLSSAVLTGGQAFPYTTQMIALSWPLIMAIIALPALIFRPAR